MVDKYKLQQQDIQSMDLNTTTLDKLRQLLPEVFTENHTGNLHIDIEKLKIALGGAVDVEEDNQTRYSFLWSDKKQAQLEANKPTTATLRPCVAESKNCDNTENVYIEGDNLEVLKLLQKSYYGKIKMIYIDPPYNTGKDFVYKDNYRDNMTNYLKITGQVDDNGNRVDTNSDTNGRYHTDWLNMMYPRLKLARNLLKDDGVIFISIDDNEVHNLRKVCDEIFGEDNFRNIFAVRRYDKNLNRQFIESGLRSFNTGFEYIVCYSKSIIFNFEAVYKASTEQRCNNGYWKGFWNDADRPTMRYQILGYMPPNGQWKWKESRALIAVENYIKYQDEFAHKMSLEDYWYFTDCSLEFIRRNITGEGRNMGVENWMPPSDKILRNTNWTDIFASRKEPVLGDLFDYPKNKDLIQMLISASHIVSNDIILDFFSGSATTAHAVMQLNAEDDGKRKYICVQLPETTKEDSEAYKAGYKNICEIGKERIRRAGDKVLAEFKTKQQPNDLLVNDLVVPSVPDIGFKVFKLDTSNIKPFNNDDLLNLDLCVENRTSLDLFYELVIKQGYTLEHKQSIIDVGGTKCYALLNMDNVPFVLAVLDDMVKDSFATAILKYPLSLVVVKDSCFSSDEIKLNALATLDQLQTSGNKLLHCNDLQIRII